MNPAWFVLEGWDKLSPDLQHHAHQGHALGRMPWFYANGWHTLSPWQYKFATPYVAVVDSPETVLLGAQTQWAFTDACFAIKNLIRALDDDEITISDKIVGVHLLFSIFRFYRHDIWRIHHTLWATILDKTVEFQRDSACGDVSQWLRAVLGMEFVGVVDTTTIVSEPALIEFHCPSEVPDAIAKYAPEKRGEHHQQVEQLPNAHAQEGKAWSWVPWNWF